MITGFQDTSDTQTKGSSKRAKAQKAWTPTSWKVGNGLATMGFRLVVLEIGVSKSHWFPFGFPLDPGQNGVHHFEKPQIVVAGAPEAALTFVWEFFQHRKEPFAGKRPHHVQSFACRRKLALESCH